MLSTGHAVSVCNSFPIRPVNTPSETAKPPSSRLLSLDALRGFDMLWILGLMLVLGRFLYRRRIFLRVQLTVLRNYQK